MESNSTALFAIDENPVFVNFGIIYFIISGALLPLYAIVMTAIHKKDQHKTNMTYKLMNIINFFEVGQGFCHFVASPIMIFPTMRTVFEIEVRILGCIINTFWIGEMPVMAILAVCRILVFCNIIKTDKTHSAVKLVLFIVIAWVSFVLIIGCSTQNFAFFPPSWAYDFEVPNARLFSELELIVSFPCLAVIYGSYLIIFLVITNQKKNFSNSSRKNEIAIMLQYTFVTTYMTILIILWHRGDLILDLSNLVIQASINTAWIACSYLNPVLLLILNQQIRDECKFILGFRRPVIKRIRTVTSLI